MKSASAIDSSWTRPPLFRAARTVLAEAERNLPPPVYKTLYRGAFAAYRAGVSVGYRNKVAGSRRRGEWDAVRRGEAVIKTMPFSLVGPNGLEATYRAVFETVSRGIPGAIVECGVARGGSSALMALALRDAGETRHMWLFDSYEGLPDATAKDIDPGSGTTGAHVRPLPKGSCLGTLEEVEHLMRVVIGVSPRNFTMVKGWFQNTLPQTAIRIPEIAVLRLDGDWYESTRCCLDALYDLVVPGGVVISDDFYSCFGARQAVLEFLAERGDSHPAFLDDGSGGVLYTKG